MFYGLSEISYLPLVELASLSVVLGNDISKTSLFALNLMFTGCILIRDISTADQTICQKSTKLGKPFKNFIVSHIRLYHILYVTMMGILVRNIFPDPSTICQTIERGQREVLDWFCAVIITCIDRTSPAQPRNKVLATSRGALCKRLRIDNIIPSRIDFLSKLVPDFIHVSNGGP